VLKNLTVPLAVVALAGAGPRGDTETHGRRGHRPCGHGHHQNLSEVGVRRHG
jgi:hypothetical protein